MRGFVPQGNFRGDHIVHTACDPSWSALGINRNKGYGGKIAQRKGVHTELTLLHPTTAITFVRLLGSRSFYRPFISHKLQKRFVRHEIYIKLGNAFRRFLVLPRYRMHKGSRSKVVQWEL